MSDAYRKWVETTLAKNRDDRYQTALELAEDLDRLRKRRPIAAKPASAMTKLVRWAQRNPAVAAMTSLLFLALSLALSSLAHSLFLTFPLPFLDCHRLFIALTSLFRCFSSLFRHVSSLFPHLFLDRPHLFLDYPSPFH